MTYLARAWNRRDLAAICHVTDPGARSNLAYMAIEARHLQLHRCTATGGSDYSCDFIHAYPHYLGRGGVGRAWLEVAPATRPGWYVTTYEGCG